MKKVFVIIFVLIILIMPATVLSHDTSSALQTYIEADTVLPIYIEEYSRMVEKRDEDVAICKSMYLNRRNSFYLARSLSERENSILRIDFAIQNMHDEIKARKALLKVEFRSDYANLYLLKKTGYDSKIQAASSFLEYSQLKTKHRFNFISDSKLMQLEYKYLTENNTALRKQRQYESALRRFNYKMNLPFDFNEYTFDFDENMLVLQPLEIYILSALKNSLAVKKLKQKLTQYEVENKNYSVYTLSTGFSYIADVLRQSSINTRLLELLLSKTKSSLKESITTEYSALKIEKEKLDLAVISMDILQEKCKTYKSLSNLGYVDRKTLLDLQNALIDEKKNYKLLIYKYNTRIKSLESDCAYYFEEKNQQ